MGKLDWHPEGWQAGGGEVTSQQRQRSLASGLGLRPQSVTMALRAGENSPCRDSLCAGWVTL